MVFAQCSTPVEGSIAVTVVVSWPSFVLTTVDQSREGTPLRPSKEGAEEPGSRTLTPLLVLRKSELSSGAACLWLGGSPHAPKTINAVPTRAALNLSLMASPLPCPCRPGARVLARCCLGELLLRGRSDSR